MWSLRSLQIILGLVFILLSVNLSEQHAQLLLKDIPKQFVLTDNDPTGEFQKYIQQIKEVKKHQDVNVKFKVAVEANTVPNIRSKKKWIFQNKSKKFNVPLKIKHMKKTNYIALMKKKMENQAEKRIKEIQAINLTSDNPFKITTTKRPPVLKYKPIISKLKTRYRKRVLPVKNAVITLG